MKSDEIRLENGSKQLPPSNLSNFTDYLENQILESYPPPPLEFRNLTDYPLEF